MPAGFQAVNANNIVQIDASYKNYILKEKGYGLLNYDNSEWLGNPANAYTVTVNNAVNPLIAMHTKEFVRTWRIALGNGSFMFKFTVAYNNRPPDPNLPFPAPFWWYVYDSPPPAASVHGVGMQVFNGSGQITFDSGYQYMKVLGTVSQIATFPPVSRVENDYRFGNDKVAFAICQQAILCDVDFLPVGPGGEVIEATNVFTITAAVRKNQSTITTWDALEYTMPSGTINFINTKPYTLLAIDVSTLG